MQRKGQMINFDYLKLETPIRHLNGDFYRLKVGRRLLQGRKIPKAKVTGFIEYGGKLKAGPT